MTYIILILTLLAIVAGFLAYLSIKKNAKLNKDIILIQKQLTNEMMLRTKIEEANKVYVQKLATLSQGTDADRFHAAASIMSDNSVPPSKPATKP